jgi:hypothetical protein
MNSSKLENQEGQQARPDETGQAPAKPAKGADGAPRKARVPTSKGKPARKASHTKRGGKRPQKAATTRQGTKSAAIMALLEKPKGASLAELTEATGWQAHSVRGFLSGAIGKKMGLQVRSTKLEDGTRVYAITR